MVSSYLPGRRLDDVEADVSRAGDFSILGISFYGSLAFAPCRAFSPPQSPAFFRTYLERSTIYRNVDPGVLRDRQTGARARRSWSGSGNLGVMIDGLPNEREAMPDRMRISGQHGLDAMTHDLRKVCVYDTDDTQMRDIGVAALVGADV